MKHVLPFLLLLIIGETCFAGAKKQLCNLFNDFNYQGVKNGLTELTSSTNKSTNYKAYLELDRQLIGEFHECVVRVGKHYSGIGSGLGTMLTTFRIKYIHNHDSMAYYEVLKEDGYMPITESVVKCDSSDLLKRLRSQFYALYGRDIRDGDLLRTNIRYGDHCGITGTGPEFRWDFFNNCVANKDTSQLKTWLRSANLELQCYAIEGLLRLRNAGYVIDSTDDLLIKVISQKEGNVNYCGGCMYSGRTMEFVLKQLKLLFEAEVNPNTSHDDD